MDPESGSAYQNECGSDRIQIHITDIKDTAGEEQLFKLVHLKMRDLLKQNI